MCSRGTTSLAGSSPDFFFKGGRKISVGDCALFKPPQGSPPFVGIILWVTAGEGNNLKLGVNWLYRPSDVKLGKGILLEAVPNEIFYSFHKDEIPAASVLHPCKVAFLPKGVELPSGISSFVCRRVYDITNKCLWWLTDQDYSDQRQEEVDLLLYKTRIELLATEQPGVYSTKPMNGPTSTSQLKSGSDSVQNVPSPFPSQVKGKKRERGDQGFESVKRASKIDDGDSANSLKTEIAKITDRGGLVDSEAVGRLVQLMLLDKADKKIDLGNRSMLAGVIAATEKFECLSQFVQLRGLPVFDEWLQEVHKGKIYDSTIQRDGDKSVEEFLLVLLRSLDKLPVNIHALQMCNIGKSVNHLRTHKNLEIQKKARSLVDTWKKRVEAEMNIIDSKSGPNQAVPWPGRPRLHEVSQNASRHSSASEVVVKSLNSPHSATKPSTIRLAPGESNGKSLSASPASTKPALSPASGGNNLKDVQSQSPVGGSSDFPITASRDEKSSSSSPSHNSHSCSSDHTRNVSSSGKEDARSSTAGSMRVNRISGGVLHSKKSASGLQGPASPGAQREARLSRIPSHKNNSTSYEKISQSGLFCDKVIEMPVGEGNGHKLIVKIPNCGHSPSGTANGGSFGEPSLTSNKSSSPVQPEKQEHFDGNFGEKNDAYQAITTSDVNIESEKSNNFKDSLTGFNDRDGSSAVALEDESSRNENKSRKIAETSPKNDSKAGKLEASINSMNAFIESCVKYSEADAAMSFADDGMNLLASVAAGEMSISDLTANADSPGKATTLDNSCTVNTSKSSDGNGLQESKQCNDSIEDDTEKQIVTAGTSLDKNRDKITTSSFSDEKPTKEQNELNTSPGDVKQSANLLIEEQSGKMRVAVSNAVPSVDGTEKAKDAGVGKQFQESEVMDTLSVGGDFAQDKVEKVGKETAEGLSPALDDHHNVDEGLKCGVLMEHKRSILVMHSDSIKETNIAAMLSSSSDKCLDSKNAVNKGATKSDKMKFEKADEAESGSLISHSDKQRIKVESNVPTAIDTTSNLGSVIINLKDCTGVKIESNEVPQDRTGGTASNDVPAGSLAQDESEESASTTPDAAATAAESNLDAKLKFDLNEGFSADEGKYDEPSNPTVSSCSAAGHIISPVPFPASVVNNLPASITVAAAAKGPFVPPDDLLRNKGEVGWKGSAATSAFRRAEPRKVSENQLNTTNAPLPAVISSKQSRSFLDIDLNIADERVIEETAAQNGTGGLSDPHLHMAHNEMSTASVRSSGGLDLDLNRVDEATDVGPYSTSNNRRLDAPLLPTKSPSASIPNGERSLKRGFDLNDGPVLDEVSTDVSPFGQHAWNSMPSQTTVASIRTNNTEMGKFSSWFPSGNTVPVVTIPSVLPDRVEQTFPIAAGGPQRIFSGPNGGTPFGPNIFRAPVLPSSPAVSFPSAPFQYHPVFPFGTSFPPSSATVTGGTTYMDSSSGGRLSYSAGHSHLLGPASAVSSSYSRPYIISLSDSGTNAGVESNSRWVRQGLDLNAGPGGSEMEGRDKALPFASRQPSVASSQALTEEQARMYQAAGVVLKRKEPEGGWDADKYKQQSWQ